jgi:hypothetical protein
MAYVNGNGGNGNLAELVAELRIVRELALEMAAKAETALRRAAPAGGGVDLAKVTPDQLLDRWNELRGEQAEAYLLGRIQRRRARRAGNGNAHV